MRIYEPERAAATAGAAMRCPGCRSPRWCWLSPRASPGWHEDVVGAEGGRRVKGRAVGPACTCAVHQTGLVWVWVSHRSAKAEVRRWESSRAAVLRRCGGSLGRGRGKGLYGATPPLLCRRTSCPGGADSYLPVCLSPQARLPRHRLTPTLPGCLRAGLGLGLAHQPESGAFPPPPPPWVQPDGRATRDSGTAEEALC